MASKKGKNTAAIIVGALLVGGILYFLLRKKPKAPEKIVEKAYSSLRFATDTATILESSYASLDDLANYLIATPSKKVDLVGHTDSVGAESYNLDLSQRRADAVKNYLLQKGVDATKITAIGQGEKNPIADNSTKEGREANRRVDFNLSNIA